MLRSAWEGGVRVLLGLLVGFSSGGAWASCERTLTESSSVEVPIIDASGSSTIVVLDVGTLNDLQVQVDLDHTYVRDLTVSLVGPSGNEVVLTDRNGSNMNNMENTVFSDGATTNIVDVLPPYRGTFAPEEPLAYFIGEEVTGIWELRVVDNSVDSDVGTLFEWGMVMEVTTESWVDSDADGTVACDDCNDTDSTIYPGAQELCDGVLNDCDGIFPIDESDLDEDGWYACDNDCDDTDDAVNPGAVEVCNSIDDDCNGFVDLGDSGLDQSTTLTVFTDWDGDSYGDSTTLQVACELIWPLVTESGDCDDADAAVNPGALEICNGIDDNCNTSIDENWPVESYFEDIDGDTFGGNFMGRYCAGLSPSDAVMNNLDCDDDNAQVSPSATEVCNGIDDDCDQLVDTEDSDMDPTTLPVWFDDADGDGFGDAKSEGIAQCVGDPGMTLDSSDCDDGNASIFPGAAETCNALDDNCDGSADEGLEFFDVFADDDRDGFGLAGQSQSVCAVPDGFVQNSQDCDDSEARIHPDAWDIPGDGVDQDCDDIASSIQVSGGACSHLTAGTGGWLAVLPLLLLGRRRRLNR